MQSIESFLASSRLLQPLRIFKAQLRLTQRGLSLFVATSRFLNLLEVLVAFSPGSRGSYRQLSMQTLRTVQQLPEALKGLVEATNSAKLVVPESIMEWRRLAPRSSEELGRLLKVNGSDKARHEYHFIYASLLADREKVERILEIGLGTNHVDVMSHMEKTGRPGASLLAFRSFCPSAQVFGADIDARVLFQDERITTLQVDQTSQDSLDALAKSLPRDFDLVVDDGLHSPDANVLTLTFGLGLIKPGGWVVIEDIKPSALRLWQVIAALLPDGFEPHLVVTRFALVFLVRRVK
jgi:SAM-dependent methyltransferase